MILWHRYGYSQFIIINLKETTFSNRLTIFTMLKINAMKHLLLILSLLFSAAISAQNNSLVSQGTFFEGEPYLAVNPQNQQHLVAAWMGFQTGNKVVIKSTVSTNGGLTWTAPIGQPHVVSTYSSADVSLAFDRNGNVFMCYIDYDNENHSEGKVVVRKSTDGGVTWGSAVEVLSLLDCPNKLCLDRPWMVVDRSGGPNDGTVYVTNMNANQPTLVTPPYNPYVTVSTDNGASFAPPRFLDTLNFLSGSAIVQPMPSPTVASNGKFYAIYPSYVQSQSPFARMILASSTTACVDVNHQVAYQSASPLLTNNSTNALLKSGYLLRSNPNDANHLAFFFLSDADGDADIKMMETTNAGASWSAIKRINQDPIANGKLQDLVWADFDNDGDLVVVWRDRRNASGSTYGVPTEIYCAVRRNGAANFETDYRISSQQVNHEIVLEDKGNDFMNVAVQNDTAYAIWGDVRSGTLKIYVNKWNINNQSSNLYEIYSENEQLLYPNPAMVQVNLPETSLNGEFYLYETSGKIIEKGVIRSTSFDCQRLKTGTYFFKIVKGNSVEVYRFRVEK